MKTNFHFLFMHRISIEERRINLSVMYGQDIFTRKLNFNSPISMN